MHQYKAGLRSSPAMLVLAVLSLTTACSDSVRQNCPDGPRAVPYFRPQQIVPVTFDPGCPILSSR